MAEKVKEKLGSLPSETHDGGLWQRLSRHGLCRSYVCSWLDGCP